MSTPIPYVMTDFDIQFIAELDKIIAEQDRKMKEYRRQQKINIILDGK